MFCSKKITGLTTTAAALVLLLLITCKKDPYLPIGNADCYDPQEGYIDPNGIYPTEDPDYYYKNYHMPCFNPNNANEFCYLFGKQGLGGQLRKHNLQTGEDVLIYPISFSAPPKWNKNGKITFASGYQVYTIDEDGKNIKKHTTVPYNMYPAWLNDSTIICYYSKYFPNSTQSLKININTSVIDTLEVAGSIFDIAIDGKILSPGTPSLYYSTYIEFCEDQIWGNSVATQGSESRCAVWHPNCEDIYYTAYNQGLFKVNIHSRQSTLILPHCPSRRYGNITISPDGKWIIAERLTYFYMDPPPKRKMRKGKVYYPLTQKYTLEIMDINGNNRIELKLAE